MRRPLSLALRLTLLFGIASAVVFSTFGWIVIRSIEHHFEIEDVKELSVTALAAERALAALPKDQGYSALETRFDDLIVGHHGASLYLFDQDKRPLFASTGPDLATFIQIAMPGGDDESVHIWGDAAHTYRILLRRIGQQDHILAVAVAIDHHLRFLEDFRQTLWLMIAGSISLMGLMGWIAVRRGHAPLHEIVTTIRHLSAQQLDTRLDPNKVPAELADLAASFNDMFARIEESFQRLSNFSADIAHELRTPVTSLLTQTQVALSQARTPDAYREILYSNIEEYERMARMIGDMLFLAQADHGLTIPDATEVDLGNEVRALFDYYEAWAEERGVTLSLEGAACIPGDRLMLRRALGNLLSNAIRHTPAGAAVRVHIDTGAKDKISILVENPGTIPAGHLAKLFDRFYRVDASRQRGGEGAGLGLAIVKSIVAAHGGTVVANTRADHVQFRITLPVRAQSAT